MNKNNTSGISGVYFDTRSSKWRAQISVWGKKIKVGTFQTKELALQARLAKLEEYNIDNYKLSPDSVALADFILQHELKIPKTDLSYNIFYASLIIPSIICAFLEHDEQTCFVPVAIKLAVEDFEKRNFRTNFVNPFNSQNCKRFDPEDVQILKQYVSGYSVPQIAKLHSMSYSTAYRRIVVIKQKIVK